MISLLGLYQDAESQHIGVDDFPLKNREAMSLVDPWGGCHIAIDRRKVTSTADEKYKLAHEMGHCETGSWYGARVTYETWERCETRAKRRALQKLLSREDLAEAIRHGCTEVWQLAEYFNLPERAIQEALEYYREIA